MSYASRVLNAIHAAIATTTEEAKLKAGVSEGEMALLNEKSGKSDRISRQDLQEFGEASRKLGEAQGALWTIETLQEAMKKVPDFSDEDRQP